jgi:hypothetical protein
MNKELHKMNPMAKVIPKTSTRNVISSGRCDNISWVEVDSKGNPVPTEDGKKGTCQNSQSPASIIWNVDTSKIENYDSLPQEFKQSQVKKLTIGIPWAKQETFYTPQCEDAYFVDTCANPKDASTCQKAQVCMPKNPGYDKPYDPNDPNLANNADFKCIPLLKEAGLSCDFNSLPRKNFPSARRPNEQNKHIKSFASMCVDTFIPECSIQ